VQIYEIYGVNTILMLAPNTRLLKLVRGEFGYLTPNKSRRELTPSRKAGSTEMPRGQQASYIAPLNPSLPLPLGSPPPWSSRRDLALHSPRLQRAAAFPLDLFTVFSQISRLHPVDNAWTVICLGTRLRRMLWDIRSRSTTTLCPNCHPFTVLLDCRAFNSLVLRA